MKTRLLLTALFVGVFLSEPLFAQGQPPIPCQKNWNNAAGTGFWVHPGNWAEGVVPQDDENACINGTFTVAIGYDEFSPARANALFLSANSDMYFAGGVGDYLALCKHLPCANSWIDGEMEVLLQGTGGKLFIQNSMTFQGSGAIVMIGGSRIDPVAGFNPTVTLGNGLALEGFGNVGVDLVSNGAITVFNGSMVFEKNLTLNGSMTIQPTATVELTNNLTLPAAATINMEASGGLNSKLKPRVGYNPILTLNSGGTLSGAGEIYLTPGSSYTLTNNGKVVARNGTLVLKEAGQGSGIWAAETATGVLRAEKEIKGNGKWELKNHAGARIEINAQSRCLSGNVDITRGTLHALQSFRASGQLLFVGNDAVIKVEGGRSAEFSTSLVGCGG